ncbi:hypothetical protein BpHYR1_026525 [Brachionus plicatilis]|uniref:Uncharacterized protein n=1 Tax=Brachionus plicatilis TaxID=10195 RepID=A0A3M7QUF4_BRAPC|nr:hypothetical protein BpHYR1_026525 [Brachionus plicatilis]
MAFFGFWFNSSAWYDNFNRLNSSFRNVTSILESIVLTKKKYFVQKLMLIEYDDDSFKSLNGGSQLL